MTLSIDINCDLGEGFPNDAELMKFISSVNVACGRHAGDRDTIKRTVELAVENDLAIGAHPSYDDRANFGRSAVEIPMRELRDLIIDQIVDLKTACNSAGTNLRHVKPHGALYNRSAVDVEVVECVVDAIKAVDPDLILYGLSGSLSIDAARNAGIRTASEVFADRTYTNEGTLTPRSEKNALIEEDTRAIEQALRFITDSSVVTTSNVTIPVNADTLCLHGDGDHAISFARAINEAFVRRNILIRPPLT